MAVDPMVVTVERDRCLSNSARGYVVYGALPVCSYIVTRYPKRVSLVSGLRGLVLSKYGPIKRTP